MNKNSCNHYKLCFQSITYLSCGTETVHNCAFYGLYNVNALSIGNSKLTEAPRLHSLKKSLTLLHLFHNQIVHLPLDYFSGFTKLSSLNLSGNKLMAFPNIEFAPLQASLHSLRIESNKIKRVKQFRLETSFRRLGVIKLTNNSLEEFNIDILNHLEFQMCYIYLDGNNLTTLGNPEDIEKTSDIILFLGNNPWKCCENLSWMPKLGMWSRSKISWDPKGDPPPVCAEPDHLRGRNILAGGKCLTNCAIVTTKLSVILTIKWYTICFFPVMPSRACSWMQNFAIANQIPLQFVSKCSMSKESRLVRVNTWY